MASLSHENCAQCINHHPVVFIDSKVDDYESLVNGTIPQAEVILLDPTLDGVIQITSVLVGRQDICAIHIVSHGAPGCLDLGNSKLSLDTLEYYSSQLKSWTSDSSVPLLLYGCNVALGDAGSEFLAKLHHQTGSVIAATAKRTGNAQEGGTWQLEVNIGDVTAAFRGAMGNQLAFPATTQATYQGIFGSITRISVADDGTEGNSDSTSPAISADGRFVAFQSTASNLVAEDTNNQPDIFVRDLLTGTNALVSVADDGTQGNSDYFSPAISADGRFVAFSSGASNLVEGDTNNSSDIFVRDIIMGTTTRVSVTDDGTEANSFSNRPAISADGRFVAFNSGSTNLVARDTNGIADVFVRDIIMGTTTRVSVADNGTQRNGDHGSDLSLGTPAISADGRFVAFYSGSTNLVASDTNNRNDMFVRDLQMSTTIRVSVADDGTQGNNNSGENNNLSGPAISADGRFVAFASFASNLVAEDTNGVRDTFLHDLLTGTTTRVSVADDGTQANRDSFLPAISADGSFVAFVSNASNLVTGDTINTTDVFVRDIIMGTNTWLSVADDGTGGNGLSIRPAISADGRFVAFQSNANNLVAEDTNQSIDVFIREINKTPNGFHDTVALGANINGTPDDDLILSLIGAEMATLTGVDPNTLNQDNFTNTTV